MSILANMDVMTFDWLPGYTKYILFHNEFNMGSTQLITSHKKIHVSGPGF